MSRAGAAVALVFLATFTIGAPFVLDAAIQSTETTYQPEHNFTPTGGEVYVFTESKIDGATYYDNETVRNSSGTVATEGTDYEWRTSNGTLKVLSGSDLATDTDASISFTYSGQTKRQARVSDIAVRSNELMTMLALIGAVVLMLVAMLVLKGVA